MTDATPSRAVADHKSDEGLARVSGGVIAICVVITLAFAAAAWSWGANKGGLNNPTKLGPYTLNSTDSNFTLSPPSCELVTVDWHVVSGRGANFTVWPPVVKTLQHCLHNWPSTNATCLPVGCSLDNNPVCFESGLGGTCSFESTQQHYQVELWSPSGPISSVLVTFNATFTPWTES